MKTNNKNILNVAIIGCGVMGSLHARIYSNIPNVKLVAVCDSNPPSGKKIASFFKTK